MNIRSNTRRREVRRAAAPVAEPHQRRLAARRGGPAGGSPGEKYGQSPYYKILDIGGFDSIII